MGGLLARLQSDPNPLEVFVDFENAEPQSDAERAVYEETETVLAEAPAILELLSSYKGCGELIRQAINNPGDDTQNAAWEGVLPMVEQLRDFYQYSLAIEQIIPGLLGALSAGTDPEESLTNNQALTRQLATIFDFVLRFDDAKMTNPAIQNDFSYYRRTLNKMKLQGGDIEIPIKDELANHMSLFYAYPTPMMKCLSQATVGFVTQQADTPRENVTGIFAMMANVAYSMVATDKFEENETNMFCLRAMTAAIIVYDHTDEVGAFSKRSPIHIKGSINTLKNFNADKQSELESLINALRFTTVHLNDEDTPSTIKNLLQ